MEVCIEGKNVINDFNANGDVFVDVNSVNFIVLRNVPNWVLVIVEVREEVSNLNFLEVNDGVVVQNPKKANVFVNLILVLITFKILHHLKEKMFRKVDIVFLVYVKQINDFDVISQNFDRIVIFLLIFLNNVFDNFYVNGMAELVANASVNSTYFRNFVSNFIFKNNKRI